MTFRELRAASGMTIKEFAEYFHVPVRSVESWNTTNASASRACAPYLLELIEYKLRKEGILTDSPTGSP